MSLWLLIVVMAIYGFVGLRFLADYNLGMAIIYLSYSVSIIGLIIIGNK